jgi:hypothetical protein
MAEVNRSVQIDHRLSDLFHNRRKGTEGKDFEDLPFSTGMSDEPSLGDSWLEQLKLINSKESKAAEIQSMNARATFKVSKSECRPFWAPADSKRVNILWKTTKVSLSKDCVKQRKAAIRRTVLR